MRDVQLQSESGRFWRTACIALAAGLATVFFSGCDRGPAVAQVSGKVVYKNGAPPQAGVSVIHFEPTQDTTAERRQAAGGTIAADGSFELSTRRPGDGVYLGKYAVTFTVWKAPRDPVSLIKEEYTRSATTPYQVTVDGDMHDLVFELESK